MPYTPSQLSDIESIRDSACRYSRGVDRLDVDEMKRAYWPDATDDHGAWKGNAHEFCEFCMGAHEGWRSTNHCIFNHTIELDDDGIHARGEIYNVTYLFRKDEDTLDTWHGRYLDLYEKRGDEWRILDRVCVTEGSDSRSLSPMPIDSEKYRSGSFDRGVPGRRVGP